MRQKSVLLTFNHREVLTMSPKQNSLVTGPILDSIRAKEKTLQNDIRQLQNEKANLLEKLHSMKWHVFVIVRSEKLYICESIDLCQFNVDFRYCKLWGLYSRVDGQGLSQIGDEVFMEHSLGSFSLRIMNSFRYQFVFFAFLEFFFILFRSAYPTYNFW